MALLFSENMVGREGLGDGDDILALEVILLCCG
jgi:hypothetical protein